MGEPLTAEPTTEQSPLSTNSVAYQSADTLPAAESFGFGDIYRVLIIFCDKYSLDRKQVALGVFLSFLLLVFSIGTVIAWNRYNPIIQEFIIKENIEKARSKNNEKNSKERRMNRFKKFLNKKRVENHFKHSGEGVRLSSGEPSSSQPSIHSGAAQGGKIDRIAAADIAAQAALKRMQKNEPQQDASKRKIQMIAKRELEEERRKLEEMQISGERKASREEKREQELDHSSAISSVMYTSELLGEDHVRTRAELLEDIKNFLFEQIRDADDESDKAIAAVLMLYSLNKTQQRDTAVETIAKYLQNILQNPEEQKFRSIRVGNKQFQERVASAVGGRAFLEAVGFTEKFDNGEEFLVFSKSTDVHLVEALAALKDGQSVPIKIARNLELFTLKEGQKPKAPKLTDDFYNLSAAELKAEQKNKEVQVERMLTLRTKEMRQKDEQTSNYRYKYTLIRIRLPGNILMQGVFGCYEPFSAVRVFVASTLSSALATTEFTLRDAAGQLVEDESLSLAQLSLAPAALLHLVFAENPEDVGHVVADEYIELIRELE